MCSFGQFVMDQFNNPPIDIFFSVTTLIEEILFWSLMGVKGLRCIEQFVLDIFNLPT